MSEDHHRTFSFDQADAYRLIHGELGLTPRLIYYPCCGNDRTAIRAWPQHHVVYLDRDRSVVDLLKQDGIEAICADAYLHNPGMVDILLLINPTIDPDLPLRHVHDGGLVFCNNYHLTAEKMRRRWDFTLIGVARVYERAIVFERTHLEEYWQEVSSDKEFRAAPFSWNGAFFDLAAEVVEAVTGKRDNVLENYKKIVAERREYLKAKAIACAGTSASEARALLMTAEGDTLELTLRGRMFTLITSLPKKRGTADSIFVFRRLYGYRPF